MTAATLTPLNYYAAHGAALFPIPAGKKDPIGIVESFAHHCSTDPAQWAAWSGAHPGCNFGIVAGPSRLIIVDVDTKQGREAAWALWCELCAAWNIPVAAPHVQSARGGWHIYFAVPAEVDPSTLRQPDAIKKLINIRAGNGYTVAAGSFYDGTAKGEESGPYVLLSDAAPYPAPAALVAHCTRAAARSTPSVVVGTREPGDVANLLRWLAERDQFSAYEDWVGAGMALKLEFGDAGFELWELTFDDTVTPEIALSKWGSFASDPTPGVQTLNTWLKRASDMGWRGKVGRTAAAMFDGVQQLAAASGASLPAGTPGPAGAGMPMLEGQAVLAEIAAPILAEFLSTTADAPSRPAAADFPTLPESVAGHGLYEPLRASIARIVAMAETPKTFRSARVVDALAVLSLVHRDTGDAVVRRVRTLGCTLNESKIKLAATALADQVERTFVRNDDWVYDLKGQIEHDNSDNVAVFLGIIGCEIRWNAWLERAEIRATAGEFRTEWPEWSYIDDTVAAKLRTRGNRTKTRFRPAKEFFWESLLAIAHQHPHDPVLDRLRDLQSAWDGTPRLITWLSRACGVPCDPYHQAVGRNIIGGMVRRVRHPGCKHDTMAVFFGPQGTGKSTMAKLLALQADWFTDSILLGDASKELVLSLAGKMVVEISEMGMRGSTNASHVKAMISRECDAGRAAYARAVSERRRRNIFVGTTNDDEPLTDPTGNRRFLPVRVDHEIDLQWLRENIAQLVGEAAAVESHGADFALPRQVWGDAADYQEAARSASDIEIQFEDWFSPDEFTECAYITVADLAYLSSLCGLRNGGSVRGAILKRLGFTQQNVSLGTKRTRIWFRPGNRPVANVTGAVRGAVRYLVGVDAHGRPTVQIRREG